MSFISELEDLATHVKANAKKTLEVVGGGGRFAVRFRPPAKDDHEALARLSGVVAAYRSGGALSRQQELQLFVDLCDEILRRDPATNKLERVEGGDGPLRFDASDPRWADECETAHDCVIKLCCLDDQPLAISGQCDYLIDWLQGMENEIRARVEGKAAAAPASAS